MRGFDFAKHFWYLFALREPMEEFPEQLRAWRKRRKYTQKEAASWLGLSLRSLQNYEQRTRTPTRFVQRTLRREFWGL